MTGHDGDDLGELQLFVVQLGAAMNAAGEPVYVVQDRLTKMAAAYGARTATVSAFPTYLMVTMGRGEPAAVEVTTSLAGSPRLDQIAALDRLLQDAERGAVSPTDGLRRLAEIRSSRPRFGPLQSIAGYSVLTMGLCLILHPAPLDVAAAAVFGALVGVLRSVGRSQPTLQVLMPVIAAFSVSALSALAVREDVIEPGMRAMVASLVDVPARRDVDHRRARTGRRADGVRLEPARVRVCAVGAAVVRDPRRHRSRRRPLVAGALRSGRACSGHGRHGSGVLVFAAGVIVAHSAPAWSFPGLLVVLYAAWTGQVLANALFGGYVSALVGATVMTVAPSLVSRFPAAMPAHASFLPGFWLLVPGALGLIGLTELAGGGGSPGPRGHRRLHLRGRPRRAVRYTARRLGARDRPRRHRRDGPSRRTATVAEAPPGAVTAARGDVPRRRSRIRRTRRQGVRCGRRRRAGERSWSTGFP